MQLRKFFNNENFPIYGIKHKHTYQNSLVTKEFSLKLVIEDDLSCESVAAAARMSLKLLILLISLELGYSQKVGK